MDKYHHTQQLLDRLETVMREADIWEGESPDPSALASSEPFAIDTLSCSQWLQWIFIPQMKQLVALNAPLPIHFEISSYVEEAMKGQSDNTAVYRVTRNFDHLFRAK
ncbi:YqcC family protein [Photobacterium chitinilyticum]|uniref:YqcC family protein n=1 Tax=Photobacterium chitinilyticum TaxID=2485123 RepID=UPI003D0DAC61